MGSERAPSGDTIGINSRYLTRNGSPWMPVMGEFHYSRCPREEWREELLRMKAGGVDIAATYVFWNHHEEVEGQWDWTGRRDLREFIRLCGEVGLLASVRMGPWCHGEVRNGGVPDWALDKPWRLRSNDPAYLGKVRDLYGRIAKQLEGLLWKDGGPVVAIQVENEYRGRAEHLLELKRIARDAGLDVPLYTRTGWPSLATEMPFGEIAPLYGAYAEGFWDRTLRSMPGKYWAAFRFMHVRTDAAIATEQLGDRAIRDDAGAAGYPFLTCEIGGGMMSSYHRRIAMQPADVVAVALTKIGSGGNLPGYYMYHGGVNPEGRLSTLMEDQSTGMTNYNDMPVKNYDFQAPLGAFGQTRPHYHELRRLHLLFRDFGDRLAAMPSCLPERLPGGKEDSATLRWAVRSDGSEGFLFVNNHQRGARLPRHDGVRFAIDFKGAPRVFPEESITIRPGARFVWPCGLEVAPGVRLEYATAQLICRLDDGDTRTLFFAETPGVRPELKLAGQDPVALKPGRGVAHAIDSDTQSVRVVLLSEADSLSLWKGAYRGKERAFLSRADALFDKGRVDLRSEDAADLVAWVYPHDHAETTDGVFGRLSTEVTGASQPAVTARLVREAGPAREVPVGAKGVAKQPTDEHFAAAAAEWEIELPDDLDLSTCDALLRVEYRGDCARIKIGERLVFDDFSNGEPLELGLRRYADELAGGARLRLEVLPRSPTAPIGWPKGVEPRAGAELIHVELAPRLHAAAH